ncbi:hypothetical protein MRX96_021111 [Rhipicephalus microplus]
MAAEDCFRSATSAQSSSRAFLSSSSGREGTKRQLACFVSHVPSVDLEAMWRQSAARLRQDEAPKTGGNKTSAETEDSDDARWGTNLARASENTIRRACLPRVCSKAIEYFCAFLAPGVEDRTRNVQNVTEFPSAETAFVSVEDGIFFPADGAVYVGAKRMASAMT